eukprot:1137984-Rhodomonas_salina.1
MQHKATRRASSFCASRRGEPKRMFDSLNRRDFTDNDMSQAWSVKHEARGFPQQSRYHLLVLRAPTSLAMYVRPVNRGSLVSPLPVQRTPPKGPTLKRTYPAKRTYQDFRTLDATRSGLHKDLALQKDLSRQKDL